MFSYKKTIIICLILNFMFIELIQTEDEIIINNNSLHENVCMKREGCETKLSFRCGPKFCTKDMKSCINILTVYRTESLNLNKC